MGGGYNHLQQREDAVVVLGDVERELGHVRPQRGRLAQAEVAPVAQQVVDGAAAQLEPRDAQLERAARARRLAERLEYLLGEARGG